MAIEELIIPPVAQIRNLLKDFETKVPVWGLIVFTVDGYVLAHQPCKDDMPENLELAFSSMSVGLITISEDFIRLVDSAKLFRQILVDAEDENKEPAFSIFLRHVAENVMLACIFPSKVRIGLLAFELEILGNQIDEIVNLWDIKLHNNTVT
ncbi:MAG: roadblock/LC7 domain-containing protein [Candidatus Thorarchaeota archaeon]